MGILSKKEYIEYTNYMKSVRLPRFTFPQGYKVRMFEAFSGIGCQAMALKALTDNYELVGFSEIDQHAIKSYHAIHGKVPNYGDITKMETIPECDIFTYSFPCTDLSLAGKREGMGNGTRSGLVYEVLRLLKATEKKPTVLIMENVPALLDQVFIDEFMGIQSELKELGYTNYAKVLEATNYGIPQHRDRVFMVSILGDYSFTFYDGFKLKMRLKDLCEDEVDKKYFITDKMAKYLFSKNDKYIVNDANATINKTIACTVNTREGNTRADSSNYICDELPSDYNPRLDQVAQLDGFESNGRVYDDNGLAPTIKTISGGGLEPKIRVKEATKKGYAEATNGDGLYISNITGKRSTVRKGETPTLKCATDIGTVQNNQVRKLTPKECFRLMSISDSDFQKAKDAGVSDSQLYKQAGNGIVVTVFMSIIGKLLGKDEKCLETLIKGQIERIKGK